LLVAGLIYVAAIAAMLFRWVLTGEEKQKGIGIVRMGWLRLRGEGARA
jgi:hypothetical protein